MKTIKRPASSIQKEEAHKKWQGAIKVGAEVEELRWLTSDLPTDIQVGSIFGGKVLPKLKEQGLVD